jgi:hypothetical protein
MATEVIPTRLAPQIVAMLASLRRRIAAYIWSEGLAIGVAWLGVAFWVSLALDWSVEPPVWVRQGMLVLTAIVAAYILYRFILRRIWLPIADHNLALVLERQFHDFDESLLTTVELTEQPSHAAAFHPQMLAAAEHAAVRRMAGVRLADVFRRGPLLRSLAAAAVAILSVAVFAVREPQAMAVWTQRVLQSSDIPWPRRVHLAIEGFDNPERRIVVAKGADLTVVAKADTRYDVPETVQIRYRTDEGRGRENMSRVGLAAPEDAYQSYSFAFRGILSSRTFDVVGGDAALRGYRIDVVDVPTIELVLHCDYPAYTRMGTADLPARSVEVPQGSKITVRATANKDLVEAAIQRLTADKAVPLATLKLAGKSDRRHFSYTIDRLDDTQTLLFTLFDTDGIHSREPVRLNLTARPDEPPRVAVRLRGIGSAVTPDARLPLDGDITDDYGVAKLWYEYKLGPEGKLDAAAAVKVPLATNPRQRTTIHFDRQTTEALDLKDRGLTIGQQLVVAINAEDNCTLNKTPNFGPGEKFQLAVVAPEQLLSILEARELTLRMRLESIVQDVTISRDRLARLDFAPPAKKPAQPKNPAAAKPPATPLQPAGGGTKPARAPATGVEAARPSPFAKADPGSEPGDVPTTHSKAASEGSELGDAQGDAADSSRGLSAPPVVVQQAVANGQQSASETASLALSFDDIREELANNRVDTPQLEYRLKDQIGDPLRRIAETMFPELETRLRKLDAALADPSAGKARRDEAVQQADAILVEMRLVLNKMLELESFNEIVERLRNLIESQKAIHRDTQKKQKEKTLRIND